MLLLVVLVILKPSLTVLSPLVVVCGAKLQLLVAPGRLADRPLEDTAMSTFTVIASVA